jgi:hypothetical protein
MSGPSILVDASKDSGVWWFPQTNGPFDPTEPHQGKALADYLRLQGYDVIETPRLIRIDCVELSRHHLVIARPSSAYSAAELAAYGTFVSRGGRLILLYDHTDVSNLAQSFGVQASGAYTGLLTSFTPHPITTGVSSLIFAAGAAITSAPPQFLVLARLARMPVMGIMSVGLGEVFYLGDTNGIEGVPQPFVDNLLARMTAGARPIHSCPQRR